jgi:hypothetical protein
MAVEDAEELQLERLGREKFVEEAEQENAGWEMEEGRTVDRKG